MPRGIRNIYFDYAATTPLDARVRAAMAPYFGARFGNPGSLHSYGQEAIAAVDRSRETVARLIGADFSRVVFTGTATEANNLVLLGAIRRWREAHPGITPRIIVSAIEHESILAPARDLARAGADVVAVPVDRHGALDPHAIRRALTPHTALVSIMYVNNETGTAAPIREIAESIRAYRKKTAPYPIFHTDAAQAFQLFDCRADGLGIDAMTVSGHKIYGPKGVGALYLAKPLLVAPIVFGGGQEYGLRSGTENVPYIVGFAKAAEIAAAGRKKERRRIAGLAAHFWSGWRRLAPRAEINGFPPGDSGRRSPHILNIYTPGKDAADMLFGLDRAGIAASSGSACGVRAHADAHAIQAMFGNTARAGESIRWSFGRNTTMRDIDTALKIAKMVLLKI